MNGIDQVELPTKKCLICWPGFGLVLTAVLMLGVGLAAGVSLTPSFAANSNAPESGRTITAAVYVSPPFVEKRGAGYSGMAIELWEGIVAPLGLETRYVAYGSFRELMAAVENGRADVGVTNLTITQSRAKVLSFTQPWYDAGLRIMVRTIPSGGFRSVFDGLRRSGHLQAYSWLLGIILIATLLLTVFYRRFDTDFPRRWREGVAESFFSVMSIATSGKTSHRTLFGWFGRAWAGIWLACGVAVVAYITSSITSVMTTISLTNQIHSVSDLSGRTTGVFEGSVAEEYATTKGLKAISYSGMDDAVLALREGIVAAIIGDAPVLEYYAHSNPAEHVSVVGNIFHPDNYGFALPLGSPLTRPLTLQLLGFHDAGSLRELRRKYFGHAP